MAAEHWVLPRHLGKWPFFPRKVDKMKTAHTACQLIKPSRDIGPKSLWHRGVILVLYFGRSTFHFLLTLSAQRTQIYSGTFSSSAQALLYYTSLQA